MTYEETLAWMHSMPRIRTTPSLDRIRTLLSLLGNPEESLKGRFLHVTGTNGKGSTCAFLASALRCAGYRTGRFISPFIMEFTERMEINGTRIAESAVAALGDRVRRAAEQMQSESGTLPLEFELVTAMGLLWFAEEHCDLVVLEVGIGGTFDPTNVVTPLLSCITHIDLDHTELLGDTPAKIAEQKAGIIKENAPCILSARQHPEVLPVIRAKCEEMHAPLIIPAYETIEVTRTRPGDLRFLYQETPYRLTLSGLYQLENALTAIEALRLLPSLGFPVPREAVTAGLASARFPARFEVLAENPCVILDGAHNASGMEELARNIDCFFSAEKPLLLCGMLRDKNPAEALAPLFAGRKFPYAVCITPPSPRALPGEELAPIIRKLGTPADCCSSLSLAVRVLKEKSDAEHCPIVCFGSLYTAGDIRRLFRKYHEED